MLEFVDDFELEVEDRRIKDDIIDALARSKKAKIEATLLSERCRLSRQARSGDERKLPAGVAGHVEQAADGG